MAAEEQPVAVDNIDQEATDFIFGKKKKSKSKSKASSEATEGVAAAPKETTDGPYASFLEGETDDTYDELLELVYKALQENNPELMGRERKRVKPPQVSRVGTTRTAWSNLGDACTALNRAQDHIVSFFLAELGTTGAIDGTNRLLLKGKFQPKYIESLLRKYVQEYVMCQMCRSTETDLTRDPISRLYFMNCKSCGSTRSVVPIKAGFHATAKGERKKAREAAG